MNRVQSVLIVDDEQINRKILCEGFKGQYETIEAENGQEAIDVLKERADEISVILLDIIMPVMDGYGVLDYLQETGLNADIPVIIITSDDSHEMQKKMDEYHVTDLITKPFIPKIIYRRTNNVIHLYENKRTVVTALRVELENVKDENMQLRSKCEKYESMLKSIRTELLTQ